MHADSQPPASEALTISPAVTQPVPTPATVPAILLEDRVQRLEEAVAALSHAHEDWDEEPYPTLPRPTQPLLQTHSTLRAVPIPPPPTASLADFALPTLKQAPSDRPLVNLLQPVQAALPVATSVANRFLSPSSLWRDLWWDIRIAWRMVRDPAYPMTASCRVFPLFALFYVTIWPLLSAWSGILGSVMNYFVNAVVIYIAFKIVQRELRRYYDFTEKYRR